MDSNALPAHNENENEPIHADAGPKSNEKEPQSSKSSRLSNSRGSRAQHAAIEIQANENATNEELTLLAEIQTLINQPPRTKIDTLKFVRFLLEQDKVNQSTQTPKGDTITAVASNIRQPRRQPPPLNAKREEMVQALQNKFQEKPISFGSRLQGSEQEVESITAYAARAAQRVKNTGDFFNAPDAKRDFRFDPSSAGRPQPDFNRPRP